MEEDFFDTLTKELCNYLNADNVLIGRTISDKEINAIMYDRSSDSMMQFSYNPKGTPCDIVTNYSSCIYPKNVIALFPKDQYFIEEKIEGYAGIPIFDINGEKASGVLVAMYKQEIQNVAIVQATLDYFSPRVGLESQRSSHLFKP